MYACGMSAVCRFLSLKYLQQVTLPGEGNAFALIYSVEDPGRGSATGGVGAQVGGQLQLTYSDSQVVKEADSRLHRSR